MLSLTIAAARINLTTLAGDAHSLVEGGRLGGALAVARCPRRVHRKRSAKIVNET